jgi:coenzyme PQQ precursor peptide PqqA
VAEGNFCATLNRKREDTLMSWTKPEAEVVAVTMEVTAYVATL